MKDSEVSYDYINNMNKDALRSPEANELLEATPSSLLRYGAWSVAILIGVMLFVGIYIKYPDTLDGVATITTSPLPIKLTSMTGGRITGLFVDDGQHVRKNGVIAEIQNPIGYNNILLLQNIVDSVNRYVTNNNNEALYQLLSNPLTSLGDVQGEYNKLLQQISSKLLLHKEQFFDKRTSNLKQQMGKIRSLSTIASEEMVMIEEELRQSDEQFKANEKLYQEKIISKQEYYNEHAKLRQKKLLLEQKKTNVIQNNFSAGENKKQMLEIQYEHNEKERGLSVGIKEAVWNIANYIQVWQKQYLILSPFNGTLNYLLPLQVNDAIGQGEPLFAIVPDGHNYVAMVLVPTDGMGKIREKQIVHLLLDNYPYNEFGYLEGAVTKWARIPLPAKEKTSAMYRVSVNLPDTLVTSSHKKIPFSPEMTAKARIITKDRNLLQRLIATIAKLDN